ncbi:hypothetical protein CRC_00799 [Cylindrospermopsis raciborskii CS-505]|nr:hypothetical protein CRC_00799 [Cylindrospermopsis raciborskii CS-505]
MSNQDDNSQNDNSREKSQKPQSSGWFKIKRPRPPKGIGKPKTE